MAATIVGTTAITYADWAKRLDDGYKIATIIELLSQTNEILEDMYVIEGNLPTGHKTTVRTGLPQATWRLLNTGVPNAKSTTAQIVDACGNLETYAVIDKDIADLNGNTQDFRLSEVMAFLEGMSQQVAATLIYGNQGVNPERFTGLAPRYSTVSTTNSQTANNVLDAGGTASTNTSMWIHVWGNDTAHVTFPKGKITGLQHRDMGEWPVLDSAGNTYRPTATTSSGRLDMSSETGDMLLALQISTSLSLLALAQRTSSTFSSVRSTGCPLPQLRPRLSRPPTRLRSEPTWAERSSTATASFEPTSTSRR